METDNSKTVVIDSLAHLGMKEEPKPKVVVVGDPGAGREKAVEALVGTPPLSDAVDLDYSDAEKCAIENADTPVTGESTGRVPRPSLLTSAILAMGSEMHGGMADLGIATPMTYHTMESAAKEDAERRRWRGTKPAGRYCQGSMDHSKPNLADPSYAPKPPKPKRKKRKKR